MMFKEDIKSLKFKKIISHTSYSIIYELDDGRVFKYFTSYMLKFMKINQFDIERRICDSVPISHVPEIFIPLSSVYSEDCFIGYTMTKAKGIPLSQNVFGHTFQQITDLTQISERYLKLENIVKEANNQGIVFPDFLTLENIFIDENGNYQFIDYDGIQIGDNWVMKISDGLGDQEQYFCPKYFDGLLFHSNLDKKSLIFYYFSDAFHVDLSLVNSSTPFGVITLEHIFRQINLDDDDLKHKVWKCFQDTLDNEYIGEDVKRICENYQMTVLPLSKHVSIKRLRTKFKKRV